MGHRKYQKEKIANESADNRQERLENQHQYQNEKNVHNPSITDEIRKFHANLSWGPEYICSCCNQLWYKHSVTTAEKLRLSNPTAGKYLLTKTSVDGIEWICQSCYKHLKKDKIPLWWPMTAIRFFPFFSSKKREKEDKTKHKH